MTRWQSRLTTQQSQARRQHVSSSLSLSEAKTPMLSDASSPISNVSLLFWLQLHAFYTQSQIWKSLRHSSSLEHLPESSAMHSRNHMLTQVAFPFVRRMAHSTNTARFSHMINIIRNFKSNNVLTLPGLHCTTHTQLCQSIPSRHNKFGSWTEISCIDFLCKSTWF